MFLLYEVILYLVFIVALPFFLLVGFLRGKYVVNFPARMGIYRTRQSAHDLWIHAVSVGEALAAKPVIAAIARMRPGTSMVITTTTITLLAGDIDGNDVIDQFDAMTIGMNYNAASPAAADLNNDGVINVLDLEILAKNYGVSGPIVVDQ